MKKYFLLELLVGLSVIPFAGCGRFGFEASDVDFEPVSTTSDSIDSATDTIEFPSASDMDSNSDTAIPDSGTEDTDILDSNDSASTSDSETIFTGDSATSSAIDSVGDTGTGTTDDTDTGAAADTATDTSVDTTTGAIIWVDTNGYDNYFVVGAGGTHMTLAEAITDANSSTDFDLITFEPNRIESLSSVLPDILGNLTILGNTTTIDAGGIGVPSGGVCMGITGENVIVARLVFMDCQGSAIEVDNIDNVQIFNNEFIRNDYAFSCYNNATVSGVVFGPDNIVRDTQYDGIFSTCGGLEILQNQFLNTTNRAIVVQGVGGKIIGNLAIGTSVVQPDVDIINQSDNWDVWHNTFAGISSNTLNVSGTSAGHHISNNIFAFATYWGISTGGAAIIAENNLFYNNGSTPPCDNGCASQTNPLYQTDALDDTVFENVASSDFHLVSGSPAINAGVDLGMSYYVNAPDIGCFESAF